MSEPQDTNLKGCNFDSTTAKAIAGKKIIAMVTDKTGAKILAIAGQQSLSFNMKADTSEVSTKDDSTGGWSVKFHAGKSWDASIDGLYSYDDEAAKLVAKAIEGDEYVCLKICEVKKSGSTTTYKPLRMGLAVVTSDNFEAPSDDNTTYSMEFEGSGKPWLIETATPEEVTAATITVEG